MKGKRLILLSCWARATARWSSPLPEPNIMATLRAPFNIVSQIAIPRNCLDDCRFTITIKTHHGRVLISQQLSLTQINMLDLGRKWRFFFIFWSDKSLSTCLQLVLDWVKLVLVLYAFLSEFPKHIQRTSSSTWSSTRMMSSMGCRTLKSHNYSVDKKMLDHGLTLTLRGWWEAKQNLIQLQWMRLWGWGP